MKIEFLKKKKNFRKGGFHTNPDVCWEIIIFMAFIIIVAALVFSFLLFKKINQGFTVPEGDIKVNTTSVSRDRVDKSLGYFSERAQKSIQILNSPSPIVDPSL
jgi:hypothetical protein